MGCPAALLMFVHILCTAIEGAMSCCGTLVSAFWIRSGIIQGGALSGSLFAIALTPTLQDLYVSLEKGKMGMSRACADDIGGVLKRLQSLRTLARIMGVSERVAHLALKPP
eukprot:1405416-Pyramimonas_sp.AAC.1